MSVSCPLTETMRRAEEDAVVSELKRRLENEHLNPEQKVGVLNTGLNSETAHITPVCLCCK